MQSDCNSHSFSPKWLPCTGKISYSITRRSNCDWLLLKMIKYLNTEEAELDAAKQRIIIEKIMYQKENEKHQKMKYASLIIEHCLYVLWSHLDFYAIQAMAQSRSHLSFVNFDDRTLEWRKLSELLPELKKGLISTFTDTFVARLFEVHSEYTGINPDFIKALVRRIKRLLQFIIIK